MTLPRELTLNEYEDMPLLCSTVVKEIDKIAGQWQSVESTSTATTLLAGSKLPAAYQLRLTLNLDKNSSIALMNASDERFSFDINAQERTLTAHRTGNTGKTFGTFSIPSIQAPLCVKGETVTLDVFVDQSSIEIFTQEGTMSMTNLVFPQTIYNQLIITGADCKAQVRELKRIWD